MRKCKKCQSPELVKLSGVKGARLRCLHCGHTVKINPKKEVIKNAEQN